MGLSKLMVEHGRYPARKQRIQDAETSTASDRGFATVSQGRSLQTALQVDLVIQALVTT